MSSEQNSWLMRNRASGSGRSSMLAMRCCRSSGAVDEQARQAAAHEFEEGRGLDGARREIGRGDQVDAAHQSPARAEQVEQPPRAAPKAVDAQQQEPHRRALARRFPDRIERGMQREAPGDPWQRRGERGGDAVFAEQVDRHDQRLQQPDRTGGDQQFARSLGRVAVAQPGDAAPRRPGRDQRADGLSERENRGAVDIEGHGHRQHRDENTQSPASRARRGCPAAGRTRTAAPTVRSRGSCG